MVRSTLKPYVLIRVFLYYLWKRTLKVQFSSVQDGSCARIRSTPSLSQVSPKLPLKRFLTDDGPLSSFRGRSSSASSFHASLLQAIDDVIDMSMALCPQVMSQASQHFRSCIILLHSPEKQRAERSVAESGAGRPPGVG